MSVVNKLGIFSPLLSPTTLDSSWFGGAVPEMGTIESRSIIPHSPTDHSPSCMSVVRESMAECPPPSLLQNRACDFRRTRLLNDVTLVMDTV